MCIMGCGRIEVEVHVCIWCLSGSILLWNTRLRKCNSVIIRNFTSHILGLDITQVSWMVCRVLGWT